jgi:hypothetical protein
MVTPIELTPKKNIFSPQPCSYFAFYKKTVLFLNILPNMDRSGGGREGSYRMLVGKPERKSNL